MDTRPTAFDVLEDLRATVATFVGGELHRFQGHDAGERLAGGDDDFYRPATGNDMAVVSDGELNEMLRRGWLESGSARFSDDSRPFTITAKGRAVVGLER